MNEQIRMECAAKGMYDPQFEHDNCGIGAVVNIKGVKTHKTVEDALSIVENLEHRAGKDAEGKTGDGVGIIIERIGNREILYITWEEIVRQYRNWKRGLRK